MTNSSENPQPTPRSWMRAAAWRKRMMADEYYSGLDATARDGISDEDYATTMATLEAMARNLGWTDSQGMPPGGPGGCGGHRGERPDKGANKAASKAAKKAAREQQAAS